MKITIIDGSLQDYVSGKDKGVISISEPSQYDGFEVAGKFLNYGKTLVFEPDSEGESVLERE